MIPFTFFFSETSPIFSVHKWYFFPNAFIPSGLLVSYLNFYVSFYFQQEKIKLWLILAEGNMRLKGVWFTYIYKMLLILIPQSFWIHSCAIFFSFFGWQYLHSCFLFVFANQVFFFCRKSVLVFVKLIWVCCKPSGWSQFR